LVRVLTPGETRGEIRAILRGELMAILDLAADRRCEKVFPPTGPSVAQSGLIFLSDRTGIEVYSINPSMMFFVNRVRKGDRIQICLTGASAGVSDPQRTHFAQIENLSNGDQAASKVYLKVKGAV
jgi:hypothetical protein